MSDTLKPRSVTVTIYQGDDYDTLRDLRRAAEVARRIADQAAREVDGSARRLGDEPGDAQAQADAEAAEAAYDSFVDEAAGRALGIELQAIGRRRFRDLMNDHPARQVKVKVPGETQPDGSPGEMVEREETHEDDAQFGVNTDSFPAALLSYIDGAKRTIADPDFPSRQAVIDFLDDDLADGDFDGLWTAAYYLNRMPSADPRDSRFFARPRSSSAT